MRSMNAAPLAELVELQAFLDCFFVLLGVVADLLALGALQFNAIILRHNVDY